MILLDFIKENKDWKNILSKEPYCLTIKEKDSYVLFKYNQIKSDMKLDIVKESRGVIIDIDSMSVVCRGFDKFFNYGEEYADKIDNIFRVEEKIDGSIIKVWVDKNGVHISTNGVIDARDITLGQNRNKTYEDLFLEALKNNNLDIKDLELCCYDDLIMGNGSFTLIFELVSPENHIVVPYENTDIYFLGARNNENGDEYSPLDLKENNILSKIKSPKIYDLDTIDKVIELSKKLTIKNEGFVVVDEYFHRVKIKGEEYLKLHLQNPNFLSKRKILDLILNNKTDDLISYFPESKNIIDEIKKDISDLKNKIQRNIDNTNFNMNRKDFALTIKDNEYKNILFKLYSDKNYNWEEKIFNIDNINKLIDMLNI